MGPNSAGLNRRNDQNREASIKDWIRQLKDENPETRLNAVKHLGDSKNPNAVDSLIEATADPDIRIKVKAVDYLGNLRATDSIPILVQQLYLRDVDLGVKHKVLVALGKIGDPRAGEPIAEFLKRNLKSDLRGTAIFALAEAGGPEVIPSLERVAEEVDDPRIQRLAMTAAQEIRQRLSPTTVEVEPTYIMMERLREEAQAKGKKK
jgi:HEAT repeat protein